MNTQITCPKCRSALALKATRHTLNTPLVCHVCGQTFSPHFYCPDANSDARHVFEATALYFDSVGAVYTFCPEHTFTTYSTVAENDLRSKRTPLRSLGRFFDSLAFRLALAIEGLRLRVASRR